MAKLILISGSPGSGKTTFAKKLADLTNYDFINSDDFLEGVWEKNKHDTSYDRESTGTKILFEWIYEKLNLGVNIITDIVLVEGKIEEELDRLLNSTDAVWLHCMSADPLARYERRETLKDGSKPDWFNDHFKYLQKNINKMREPLKVNQQPIIIQTDNEYEPTLEHILGIINKK